MTTGNPTALLVSQIAPVTIQVPIRHFSLTLTQKITVMAIATSLAGVGLLARYLRRRRRSRRRTPRTGVSTTPVLGPLPPLDPAPLPHSPSVTDEPRSNTPSLRGLGLRRQPSVLSHDRLSLTTSSVVGSGMVIVGRDAGGPSLSPQQLGVMGMEALETCIDYWEDALSAYTQQTTGTEGPEAALALTDAAEAEFCKDLQRLLDAACHLQSQSELLFLDQRSVLFRADSSVTHTQHDLTSSADSFVSAQSEVADLREFEEFQEELLPEIELLELFCKAKELHETGPGIPYRCLRTDLARCSSDAEYVCKLHCVRLAFQRLFKEPGTASWLADAGRQLLADLMLYADKDPKDFMIAYEDLVTLVQTPNSWPGLEQELQLKGVRSLTFFDVAIDFILLDAFDDLEAPPPTVTAVVQNRWLSNGFKETALYTAVWSVLKAKRRMLKFPEGFMAHFYGISEQLSPLLAWGFLGPDERLRDICLFFKEQVIGLLIDIFSFRKSRYTCVEALATDVLSHLKARLDALSLRLGGGSMH